MTRPSGLHTTLEALRGSVCRRGLVRTAMLAIKKLSGGDIDLPGVAEWLRYDSDGAVSMAGAREIDDWPLSAGTRVIASGTSRSP